MIHEKGHFVLKRATNFHKISKIFHIKQNTQIIFFFLHIKVLVLFILSKNIIWFLLV